MIKLDKLKKPEEIKQGMTIISIDIKDNQSIDNVEMIDNGKIATKDLVDGSECLENTSDYFNPDIYKEVYKITIKMTNNPETGNYDNLYYFEPRTRIQ